MTRASSLLASMSFAVCASMLACGDLQPLLEYETDLPHASESVAGDAGSAESGGEGATSDSGGDGEPGDGDGDGDGSPGNSDGSPGDGDGEFPLCGNGVVDGGEECDDQNHHSADGCLSDCTIPRSCLDILKFDGSPPSGEYMVAPSYPRPAFKVHCDMTMDGGGWTGLTLQHACKGHLDWKVTVFQDAEEFEFNEDPCTLWTLEEGRHAYAFDIDFTPAFTQFYLNHHIIRSSSTHPYTSEINTDSFIQSEWNTAYGDNSGDVSFGSPDDLGPTTSYAAEGSQIQCSDCQHSFAANDKIYTLSQPSAQFRIGWGERNNNHSREGWYPWYSGTIFVR